MAGPTTWSIFLKSSLFDILHASQTVMDLAILRCLLDLLVGAHVGLSWLSFHLSDRHTSSQVCLRLILIVSWDGSCLRWFTNLASWLALWGMAMAPLLLKVVLNQSSLARKLVLLQSSLLWLWLSHYWLRYRVCLVVETVPPAIIVRTKAFSRLRGRLTWSLGLTLHGNLTLHLQLHHLANLLHLLHVLILHSEDLLAQLALAFSVELWGLESGRTSVKWRSTDRVVSSLIFGIVDDNVVFSEPCSAFIFFHLELV